MSAAQDGVNIDEREEKARIAKQVDLQEREALAKDSDVLSKVFEVAEGLGDDEAEKKKFLPEEKKRGQIPKIKDEADIIKLLSNRLGPIMQGIWIDRIESARRVSRGSQLRGKVHDAAEVLQEIRPIDLVYLQQLVHDHSAALRQGVRDAIDKIKPFDSADPLAFRDKFREAGATITLGDEIGPIRSLLGQGKLGIWIDANLKNVPIKIAQLKKAKTGHETQEKTAEAEVTRLGAIKKTHETTIDRITTDIRDVHRKEIKGLEDGIDQDETKKLDLQTQLNDTAKITEETDRKAAQAAIEGEMSLVSGRITAARLKITRVESRIVNAEKDVAAETVKAGAVQKDIDKQKQIVEEQQTQQASIVTQIKFQSDSEKFAQVAKLAEKHEQFFSISGGLDRYIDQRQKKLVAAEKDHAQNYDPTGMPDYKWGYRYPGFEQTSISYNSNDRKKIRVPADAPHLRDLNNSTDDVKICIEAAMSMRSIISNNFTARIFGTNKNITGNLAAQVATFYAERKMARTTSVDPVTKESKGGMFCRLITGSNGKKYYEVVFNSGMSVNAQGTNIKEISNGFDTEAGRLHAAIARGIHLRRGAMVRLADSETAEDFPVGQDKLFSRRTLGTYFARLLPTMFEFFPVTMIPALIIRGIPALGIPGTHSSSVSTHNWVRGFNDPCKFEITPPSSKVGKFFGGLAIFTAVASFITGIVMAVMFVPKGFFSPPNLMLAGTTTAGLGLATRDFAKGRWKTGLLTLIGTTLGMFAPSVGLSRWMGVGLGAVVPGTVARTGDKLSNLISDAKNANPPPRSPNRIERMQSRLARGKLKTAGLWVLAALGMHATFRAHDAAEPGFKNGVRNVLGIGKDAPSAVDYGRPSVYVHDLNRVENWVTPVPQKVGGPPPIPQLILDHSKPEDLAPAAPVEATPKPAESKTINEMLQPEPAKANGKTPAEILKKESDTPKAKTPADILREESGKKPTKKKTPAEILEQESGKSGRVDPETLRSNKEARTKALAKNADTSYTEQQNAQRNNATNEVRRA